MKILALLQLPPPVHGASKMNKVSLETLEAKFPKTKSIDIGLAKKASDVNSFSFLKGVKFIFLMFKVWLVTLFFRPDKIYATISPTGPAFMKDFLFLFAAKLLGKPIYFHIHGNGIEKYYHKRPYYFLYNYLFYNETLIVLSPALKLEYSILEVQCNFRVVPNFNSFTASSVDEKESSRLNINSMKNILFFSNLREGKGIFDFYNSVKTLLIESDNVKVTIAGPWSSKRDQEKLSTMIVNDCQKFQINLNERIEFLGAVYDDIEKVKLYRNADIFVFPTLIDTFPLVVLEAMELGIPVISTNQGAIPDMLSNGAGIIVDKGDIANIKSSIKLLLSDLAYKQKIISRAQNKVKREYSKEVFEESLTQVFTEEL